jgi:hypothetical protein
LVDCARLEQLVQLVDLNSIELGRAPGAIGDGAAFLEELLGRLQGLLLFEERAGQVFHLSPLLCRCFRRQAARSLGDKALTLRLAQRCTLRFQACHDALIGSTDLRCGIGLLGPKLRQLRLAHSCRLSDQPIDRLGIAAVLRPQRLDLGHPALVLGDDLLAALMGDVEQRALELPGNLLELLCRFRGRGSVSRCRQRRWSTASGRPLEKGDPRLDLVANTGQLFDPILGGRDLRSVDHGREARAWAIPAALRSGPAASRWSNW